MAMYNDLLATYRKAIEENWSYDKCAEAGLLVGGGESINILINEYGRSVSYVIEDIDGNGIQELIILDDSNIILFLYSISNGEIKQILCDEYRDHYDLHENGVIHYHSYAYLWETYETYYEYHNGFLLEKEVIKAIIEDNYDITFYYLEEGGKWTKISHEQCEVITRKYKQKNLSTTALG